VGPRQSSFIIGIKGEFDSARVGVGVVDAAYRTDYASCAFTKDGFCLVGTKEGKLYKMKHSSQTYRFQKSVKAHTKVVNCINILEDLVLTGGTDGNIIIWNLKLKKLHTVSVG
jgi:WD40 repeat protein